MCESVDSRIRLWVHIPVLPLTVIVCKLSINYHSLFLLLPLVFYPIAPGRKFFSLSSWVCYKVDFYHSVGAEEISLPSAHPSDHPSQHLQLVRQGLVSWVRDASCQNHEPSKHFLNFFLIVTGLPVSIALGLALAVDGWPVWHLVCDWACVSFGRLWEMQNRRPVPQNLHIHQVPGDVCAHTVGDASY